MRVRLLNDGGFKGLENLNYDTVFDAVARTHGVDVAVEDLIAAGAVPEMAALNHLAAGEAALYYSKGSSGLFSPECVEVKE